MKPQKSLGRRGAVAAVIGVLAVVLIGVAGMALDMTRAYMVSSRLKTSVDATALFAAREINNANRDARAIELFWVNYRRNMAATTSYVSSTAQNPVITALDASRIQVTGTATLDTTLFNVISRRTMTVNVASIAQRQGSGLEVALVMDTTSSMASASNIPGLTKLQAAQQAVGSLLEILYGGADTQRNLWVSVVPHSRQINIGTQHSSLLNTSGIANWDVNSWGGCVQSRYTASHDIDDTGPTTAETQLRPYYWPTTYRQVGTRPATGSSSSYCQAYALQSGDTVRYCYGDNDWIPNPTSAQRTLLNTNPLQTSLRNSGLAEAATRGPSLHCTVSPLLPLTASRATVLARVNALVTPQVSVGTQILTGLQGAWYTISPNWQGYWQASNPVDTPPLPLAYNTPNMRKAIVIMTDGDNNWHLSTQHNANVRGSSSGTDLTYGPYGRSGTWNGANLRNASGTQITVTATSQSTADTALNTRFSQLCTAIKNANILVYVIGFEVATANRTMLQNCATTTSSPYYLEAPTASALAGAFNTVAQSLSNLRLSE